MAESASNTGQFGAELTAALLLALEDSPDRAALGRVLEECATAAEGLCAGRSVACGPGCPHCCVLNVAILLPEGLVIAEWLQGQLPPAALADLRQRLALHSCSVRWLDDAARIFLKAVCPFLAVDARCSIHPVRPLACRAAASFDRESCREALRPFAEPEGEIPVDLGRQTIFDAAFIALAETLRQRGLDDRSIELGTGVLAFLDVPDLRSLFLAGDRLPHRLWE